MQNFAISTLGISNYVNVAEISYILSYYQLIKPNRCLEPKCMNIKYFVAEFSGSLISDSRNIAIKSAPLPSWICSRNIHLRNFGNLVNIVVCDQGSVVYIVGAKFIVKEQLLKWIRGFGTNNIKCYFQLLVACKVKSILSLKLYKFIILGWLSFEYLE